MISLRKLLDKDADFMLEWMTDAEIQRNFREGISECNKEDVLNFIKSAEISPINGANIHYAIVNEDDEYLGTISLKKVNLTDKNAEYAISLRKKAQGQGIAYEASKQLLYKAFTQFGFQRIYLNVLSCNKRAIQLYEKCGFTFEGEFKSHLYMRQKYYNLRWYAMLKKEFNENFGGGGETRQSSFYVYYTIFPPFRQQVFPYN